MLQSSFRALEFAVLPQQLRSEPAACWLHRPKARLVLFRHILDTSACHFGCFLPIRVNMKMILALLRVGI